MRLFIAISLNDEIRKTLVKTQDVSMVVDSISLFRSDRGKNGMIYTEIGSISAAD